VITPLTREERERTADVAAKVNEVIAVVNDLTAPVTAQNLDAPEKRQAADPTESDARQWGDALVGAGLPRWLADTIVGQIEQIRADVVVSRADRDALTAERDALRADAELGGMVRRMPENGMLWRQSTCYSAKMLDSTKWLPFDTPEQSMQALGMLERFAAFCAALLGEADDAQ
jgi:hypothetical protein